jgi:hypothetical protein
MTYRFSSVRLCGSIVLNILTLGKIKTREIKRE